MDKKLRKGARVKIVNIRDNVTDEVKGYEGATGVISHGGDPLNGIRGWHITMDDGRHSKKFYEDELERI